MTISFISKTLITKPTFTTFFTRSFTTTFRPLPLTRLRPSVQTIRPVVALTEICTVSGGSGIGVGQRCFSSRPATSSLNDPQPNWNNRPPKETILLDGCDFEHWLIVLEKPEREDITRDEIIDEYIQTLAKIVGSEEEARKSIYSVSTKHYYAFGCIISEELSIKMKDLPKVRWVLPDSYLDVRNKDYGGEPFIDGQAVPYDPKYHEEWVRNNARANDKSRRNDRPRNFDRSKNFDRRNDNLRSSNGSTLQNFSPNEGGSPPSNPNMRTSLNPNMQNTAPNMGGGPPPYNNPQNNGPPRGGPTSYANQNYGPNMGGQPTYANQNSGPNMGGPNMGGPPTYASQNSGPNLRGFPPHANQNYGPNMGGQSPYGSQNPGPNMGGPQAYPNQQFNRPNMGGPGGAMPNRPNSGYQNNMNMGGGMPYRDAPPNPGYSNPMPNRDFQPRGDASFQGPSRQFNNFNNGDGGGVPSGNVYQVRDTNGGNVVPSGNVYQVRDPNGGNVVPGGNVCQVRDSNGPSDTPSGNVYQVRDSNGGSEAPSGNAYQVRDMPVRDV